MFELALAFNVYRLGWFGVRIYVPKRMCILVCSTENNMNIVLIDDMVSRQAGYHAG